MNLLKNSEKNFPEVAFVKSAIRANIRLREPVISKLPITFHLSMKDATKWELSNRLSTPASKTVKFAFEIHHVEKNLSLARDGIPCTVTRSTSGVDNAILSSK